MNCVPLPAAVTNTHALLREKRNMEKDISVTSVKRYNVFTPYFTVSRLVSESKFYSEFNLFRLTSFSCNKLAYHTTVIYSVANYIELVATYIFYFLTDSLVFFEREGLEKRNIQPTKNKFLKHPKCLQQINWYKARVYGRSLAGIAGSNPAGGMDDFPF
jgi:hypothetical protein